MTNSEIEIMLYFRQYRVEAGKMLFFNAGLAKSHPARFYAAMASLVREGLITRERRQGAYSLTPLGFRVSKECLKVSITNGTVVGC